MNGKYKFEDKRLCRSYMPTNGNIKKILIFRNIITCTVSLYWSRTTWANAINFVMNDVTDAGSIARPINLQSSALPLCYGCPYQMNGHKDNTKQGIGCNVMKYMNQGILRNGSGKQKFHHISIHDGNRQHFNSNEHEQE